VNLHSSNMASMRVFAVMFVTVVQLSYADTFGVLRAGPASAEGNFAVDTKLADTVRALDTNGNGKVDKSELAVFAKSQGLSSKEVLSEFEELDINHDGALDASEIGPLFGGDDADVKTKTAGTFAAPPEAAELVAAEALVAPATSLSAVNKMREALKPVADEHLPAPASVADVASPVQLAAGGVAEETTTESMGLDLVALERDAQEQAGGIMASRLAQRAQVLLARSAVDEHKAKAFDEEVRTLRGNATALAKSATKEARAAAHTATKTVSKEALVKLAKLQAEEHKAVAAADDSRLEAREAMARVRKAQASLRSS